MWGMGRMRERVRETNYKTVYAGKAHQQTEHNVQLALDSYQSINQSSIDKIVARATKKGSCSFSLNYDGSISSLH